VCAARRRLLELQRADGHWCGELEGDSILESEYILTMCFLGRGAAPKLGKVAEYLRRLQLADGGWSNFPGGDAEISSTVKAYFALKLVGDDPGAEHMERARRAALRLGGLRACNSYTKLYLAIFGQYPWRLCPAVPPEMILLSNRRVFSIYSMSAWSRAIVVPLSMIWAHKPFFDVGAAASIAELDAGGSARHRATAATPRGRAWATLFEAADGLLKLGEALRLTPLRRRALARCERWILERLEKSDGLGAIFPPIVNTIFALRSHGYALDHPVLAAQIAELERLEIEEEETLRLQPCKSPVWDTAQALTALLESGVEADDPAVVAATDWLLEREVRVPGDCQLVDPSTPVGGWYFEYANEFYPDCDDTAEVISALSKAEPSAAEGGAGVRAALERATAWLLSMQNEDGGWASFDRGCDREVLTFIPFADHNAMIDPSTVDITGRALEALSARGFEPSHPAVRRGVEFILRQQENGGSWYGRWGANHLYGTWLALSGLAVSRVDVGHRAVRRGVEWLLAHQNRDGGWGESLRSYQDRDWIGRGESTASQTSWALLGLIAAGQVRHAAVRRGVRYLLAAQGDDGGWAEEPWTGTGFPGVFYLRYHYYATYFPLLALSSYRRALERREESEKVA
jgi:squalene-hopene/tetraprenyl-beta-curcumene cyclase